MRARIAAALIAVCVAVLLADYVVANWSAPRDEKLVKSLQQQVKNDAGASPKLTAEQKRITAARQSRKQRDNLLAWILIAAGAMLFLPLHEPSRVPGKPQRQSILISIPRAPRATAATAAPQIDLTFVDQLVTAQGSTSESAILLLQAIQQHYRYLPDEAVRRLCELTGITPAQVAGASSFYAQFRHKPVGRHIVRVCHGTACHVAGATQITDQLRRYLQIKDGNDTDGNREFTIEEVACVGCCSLAPVVVMDGETKGRQTPSTACDAINEKEPA